MESESGGMSLRAKSYDEALAKKQAQDARRRDLLLNAPQTRRGRKPDTGAENGLRRQEGGNPLKSAPRKPLKAIGKKGSAWIKARNWLKRQFRYRGLTYCMIGFSGCWYDEAIGFAHPAKRRNLKEGELYLAVPCCNPCHLRLEVLPPSEMRYLIESAWAQAGIKLPQKN